MNQTSLDRTTRQLSTWLLLVGIVLVASNLRVPLTSVGPLITFIREDLGISNAAIGTITTLPLLAFAFLSPFAPKIANRIGMEWTIFFSLLLLFIGLVLRSSLGTVSLFTGTMIIGLAIAIGNVLLPGIIKMKFPLKIGLMTGMYAVFMNVFGALGSGLSIPISSIKGVGWRSTLLIWGLITVAAILFWLPQLKRADKRNIAAVSSKKGSQIWRSGLAWNITLFMGMQSLIFYTLITWLPEILRTNGFSSTAAGWLLFLLQFALIPITFIVPLVAEKLESQSTLAAVTSIMFLIGIASLLFGNQLLTFISVILIGVAGGSAFSLSMMFFSLRTSSGQQAAQISGMAQSIGYLFAATGPVLFGALHDITGNWTIPIFLLIGISIVIFVTGIQAGKKRVINDTIG